ncbi:hypothetical protein HNR17_000483 [Galbitalea soli]|nr:hypothetical protein [Galbitalea soli]
MKRPRLSAGSLFVGQGPLARPAPPSSAPLRPAPRVGTFRATLCARRGNFANKAASGRNVAPFCAIKRRCGCNRRRPPIDAEATTQVPPLNHARCDPATSRRVPVRMSSGSASFVA